MNTSQTTPINHVIWPELDQLLTACLSTNTDPDWQQLRRLLDSPPSTTPLWQTLGSDGSEADLRERLAVLRRAYPELQAYKNSQQIHASLLPETFSVYIPLARFMQLRSQQIRKQHARAALFGINGGQGSGKTTINAFLQIILSQGFGLRTAGLSIDDVYKTHAERQAMGREVHPLFAIRSVAGTHDTELASRTLHALMCADADSTIAIPRFDKMAEGGQGDRFDESDWPRVHGPLDVVIFEGWCVGAQAQADSELQAPVNQREAEQDPQGVWRSTLNQYLAHEYRELFALLDELLVIQVRSMEDVFRNRELQELHLRRQLAAAQARGEDMGTRGTMSPEEIVAFISLYERTTRHMLATLPDQARLTLYIGEHHRMEQLRVNMH